MRLFAITLLTLFTTLTASAADQGDTTVMKPQHYFVRLLGTRAGWPDNMTPQETQVMSDHFAYLKDLTARKKVISAGPVFTTPPFGLIILQTTSETEAREIMAAEPSVVAGVHTYEMTPMVLSLLTDYRSPNRYVKNPGDRAIRKEAIIPAPVDSVWHLWTTSDGLESFLAEKANVELRPGGPFEIYFSMDAPVGQRGSEDCKILSYLPNKMFSFEWNAPPSFPTRRDYERTWVVLEFDAISATETKLTLTHLGWGEGEDWDGVFAYFDAAWGKVLEFAQKRFGN